MKEELKKLKALEEDYEKLQEINGKLFRENNVLKAWVDTNQLFIDEWKGKAYMLEEALEFYTENNDKGTLAKTVIKEIREPKFN